MGISVILQEGQISKDMRHIYKYTKYSTSTVSYTHLTLPTKLEV